MRSGRGMLIGRWTAAIALSLFATTLIARPKPKLPTRLWVEQQPGDTGLSLDTPVTMGAFAKLTKLISPAVLNITVIQAAQGVLSGRRESWAQRPVRAEGTGFFIHPDGYILTNHHVVERAQKITVRTTGDRTFEARVVGSDPYTDLALLKINASTPFPVAPLGDSDKLETGEWVIAIGSPYGLDHTVTAGIVSAKGRSTVQPGQTRYSNYIQTDASINPGNSGGPLVNIRGQVVGINAAVHGRAQGIGFAIPVNMVKKLVPQLARGRIDRSWLGISVREVTPEVAHTLHLQRAAGAYIERLVAGSPAANAGLQPGDVIVRFGEHDVHHSSDLPWLAASAGVGSVAQVHLIRQGKPMMLLVKLSALPRKFGGHGVTQSPAAARSAEVFIDGLGIKVATLTARLKRRFKMAASQGALVVAVDRGGPAELVGLRVGDVIVGGYRTRLRTAGELSTFVSSFAIHEMVPLRIIRGRRPIFFMPKKTR